jgi:N-dimethylarginine dimethylaminohydrolase
MSYNIYNKWDPLKVCMLGNNYAPEFFNGIPDKAGDPLKRICEETLEDLEGYKSILQDFGVEVIQPQLDNSERFTDNPHRYRRGPLQPRDQQVIIGNTCFTTRADHPSIHQALATYDSINTLFTDTFPLPPHKYNQIACKVSGDWPKYDDYVNNCELKEHVAKEIESLHYNWLCFSSASSFLLNDRLLIGCSYSDIQRDALPGIKYFIKKHAGLDLKLEFTNMDGHTDGNFHPIKPGAILSLYDVQNYSQTFPGWDICYLPDQSWSKVKPFLDVKRKNQGKWWLAGEEDNDEFTHFVETWLQDWVGYVEETVFDVNVLMLDQNHCCVSNPNNEKVNAFLKKHKVEPVYVPWRHRYFWDGGLHCITLDLYREGKN